MNRLLLYVLLLFVPLPLYSQVVINEFSASNYSGITDEDGDHSDWLELYNPSSSAVNIGGYYLSDNQKRLNKWTLPTIDLGPHSYLLVFASGKDRTEIPVSYQTVIRRGDSWKYFVPSSEIGNGWKNNGFNDATWNSGLSGFGYGDDDDSTVLPSVMTVYIRKEFTISDPADISELILSIDYDDGFVAYINGHEIARSNLGTSGSTVTYNQAALGREALMFSGGYPENYFVTNPSSVLTPGINIIAIEGHNTGTTSTDFSLIPMVTISYNGDSSPDDVPGYIQLSGKKLHTNFKIAAEGETLFFSNADSSVIDSVPSVGLVADATFGHKPDGTGPLFYFHTPTPGSSNIYQSYTSLPVGDTVKFSAEGGYFPATFQLVLSSPDPADTIFYTLDGSEPSRDGLVYSIPLQISNDCVVRAISLNINKLPGVVSTRTYIKKDHTLPVVCLTTDPYNLWDNNYGIYVLGPNASDSYPYFGANFWQDWERKAHMELYDANGIKQIDQDIGVKIYGNYSRANAQKSMALYARREYGKGSFKYKFFKDKPIDEFESIILRNGGNDWDRAIIRDGLTSTLVRDMDVDRLAFQPAIIYINGEYWGILNIREKISQNYVAENHFVDPEKVNLLENLGGIVDGDNMPYLELVEYLNVNTLESDNSYQIVANQIDVNNFIQYQLTEIYIDNRDWPGNNIKFWNTTDPGSKWRWIFFDTDFGFSIWDASAYTFNTLEFALATDGPGWPNPPWSTLLLRRMISNPGFKNEFINQYADRINTNFTAERVNAVVDSIKQLYIPEITEHISRWGLNYSYWQTNYSNIKSFATNRPSFAREHLKTMMELTQTYNIRVEVSIPGAGRVQVNSVIPSKYPFTGVYFKGVPIKLTAIPAPGYKFTGWESGGFTSFPRTLYYNMEAGGRFRALFSLSEPGDNNIVINEINYNSSPDRNTEDWVELYNAGKSTVNLKGWRISDAGPESGFIIPDDVILVPGSIVVICHNTKAFRNFYPGMKNITGDLDFGLSSTGDDINLYDDQNNLIDYVSYTPNSPWPTDANGTGASIELTDPFKDNNLGKNWRSKYDGGSPGEKNILTAIDDLSDNPKPDMDLRCYPSPFRDFTTIYFKIDAAGKYRVQVYDLQGRMIKTIADRSFDPGSYYLDWHGDSPDGKVKEGLYFIKLTGSVINTAIKVVYLGE
jgi:hypothetical protein